jgi:hypothetical protein
MIVGALQIGPIRHQVLGHRTPPLTSEWRMYTSPGRKVCKVTWYANERGHDTPLDVMAIVHPGKRPHELSKKDRTQRSADEVRALAAVACARSGLDVRADAWCGADAAGAWRPATTASEVLCPSGA